MKANELRIFNWLIDYENKIGKVESIEDNNVLKVVNNEGVLISYCEIELYKPIPLTEEILLKCGFEITEILGSYHIGGFTFHSQRPCNDSVKFTLVTEIYFCGRMVLVVNGVKHLHQLQNLYFALTNEELNIEL